MKRSLCAFLKFSFTNVLFIFACTVSYADESVDGKWKIAEILCESCASRTKSEIGTIIDIKLPIAQNPLSGTCNKAGYESYGTITYEDLSKILTLPINLEHTGLSVKNGAITCDSIEYMRLLRLNRVQMLYQWEGDIVFLLEKLDS